MSSNFSTNVACFLNELKIRYIEWTLLERQIKFQFDDVEQKATNLEAQVLDIKYQMNNHEAAIMDQAEGKMKEAYKLSKENEKSFHNRK